MLTLITLFLLRKIQNYVPVVTLSAQKLSKLLSKEFEKLVYCNECKTKSKNKNTTNEYRYFTKSNSAGVNRLFAIIYTNQDNSSKRIKTQRYYLPKGIINNYNIIINGKNFYDEPIDSDIRQYK